MKFTYNGETLESKHLMFCPKQQAYVDKLEAFIHLLITAHMVRMEKDMAYSESVEKLISAFTEVEE